MIVGVLFGHCRLVHRDTARPSKHQISICHDENRILSPFCIQNKVFWFPFNPISLSVTRWGKRRKVKSARKLGNVNYNNFKYYLERVVATAVLLASDESLKICWHKATPPTDRPKGGQSDGQMKFSFGNICIFVVVKCVGNHLHLNWSILVYSLFINGWSFHCQMAASKLNKLCSTNAECRTKPFSFLFESIFGISAQFLSWARQQCGIQIKLSLDGNKGLTAVMKTQSERHREGGDVREFCNFARDINIRKTNLTNIKQLYLNLEGLQLSSNGPNSQMH